jgi:serine/threonine-protein kinase PpkA
VGLHAGEVTLCPLGTVHHKEITPIGDTVNVAARLEAASKELGWTVVASSSVLRRGGDGIQTGGRTSLDLRGKNACVDVAEVTGIVTNLEDQRHGLAALTVGSAEVRDAVQINSQIAARATKGS